MKKRFAAQKAVTIVLALILILAVPGGAFAAGLSAATDTDSVKTGETITLTVVVSAKNLAVAQGTFTYDPNILKFLSSDGGASDGYIQLVSAEKGGSSSLTAVIKFKAMAEGEAKIKVSMESILDYSGKNLGKADDTEVIVEVTASGAGPGNSADPDNQTPAPDFSQTGVAALNVKGTDAQMYIWRSLKDITLPSGYYDIQITYGGEPVGGAAMPDNEEFVLLYLSEKTGENAGYYIYRKNENVLYPYVTVTSVQANFTVLWPDDSIKAPEGYEPATLRWKERDMPAWTAKGSDGAIYLVYARNSAGDKGFFLYNSADKSVQRYQTLTQLNPLNEKYSPSPSASEVITPASSAPESTSATDTFAGQKNDSGITIDIALFIAACAAGAVLIAAVLVLAILYFNKKHTKTNKTGIKI